MSRNNNRKRRTDLKTLIEVIFIILDAATLGTIFVFIGHDAGGPFECTSINNLCLPVCSAGPLCDTGTATIIISSGNVNNCTCIVGGSHVFFHKTFSKPPNVVLTLMNDSSFGGFTGYLTSSSIFSDSHTIITSGNVAETWTAMPAAATEIFGNTRNRAFVGQDTLDIDYVLSVNVVTAGSASAVLETQFSNDGGATWHDPNLGACDLSISATGNFQIGVFPQCVTNNGANSWQLARIVGINGNGVASPSFGLIELQMYVLVSPAVTLKVCETTIPGTIFCGSNSNSGIGTTSTYFDFLIAITEPSASNLKFVIKWNAVACQQTSCNK